MLELGSLNLLTSIALVAGDFDQVLARGRQALEISRARGESWVRSLLLNAMSQATWQHGDRPLAETMAREGTLCSNAIGDRAFLVILLETLAWMSAEQAAHERAAVVLGFAQQVRESNALSLVEPYRPQHAHTISVATESLGQAAFDAAYQRGTEMTTGEGVAFAVQASQPGQPAPATKVAARPVLTGRQLEIAKLIAGELTNKQIAGRLFLSERTVETQVTNILNKLGLSSRSQISRWITDVTAVK